MNCGVLCVERLLEELKREKEEILNELEERVTEKGLSVADLMTVMCSHGYQAEAYRIIKLPDRVPWIAFDGRHYTAVLRREKGSWLIYDPNLGEVKVAAWFYRLFHPRYVIIIR